jgi:hypothetical protein
MVEVSVWRYDANKLGETQMKRLTLILAIILSASLAHAQTAAAPTGLVVGSGNYFSPIVADLEKAIAFYGAIGFQFQGDPATADANSTSTSRPWRPSRD